jgi:hypothetical protein
MVDITRIQDGLHGFLEAYFKKESGSLSKEYGFGVSFYVTVWALLEEPLKLFQVGLPSTWIKPENDDVKVLLCPIGTVARDEADKEEKEHLTPDWSIHKKDFFRDYFQTIEGGVGFWGNTQLPTKSPKYRILGIPKCYTPGTGIGSPGWSFGLNWPFKNEPNAMPDIDMGLAQLSNRILVPPDGMPFAAGSEAKQLGVAWMALPLMDYAGFFHLQSKAETKENKYLEWRGVGQRGDKVFSAPARSNPLEPAQMWGFIPHGMDGYFYFQNLKKEWSDSKSDSIVHFENDRGGDLYMEPGGEDCYRIYAPTAPGPFSLRLGGDGSAKMNSAGGGDREQWRLVPTTLVDIVATGDSSWTLFFSSENFNGPVAFFPPATWSRISKKNLQAVGRGLDARPARMDRGAMEFNLVPCLKAELRDGTTYSRIPKLSFPTELYEGPKEEYKGKLVTPLMQDITLYSRQTIYKAVMSWFRHPKGQAASGEFAATGAKANEFSEAASIDFKQGGKKLEGISDLVEVINLGDSSTCSWGLIWNEPKVAGLSKGQFPEYFKNGKAIGVFDVPQETGLASETFDRPDSDHSYHPYVSPESGAWIYPGATGEYKTVTLGDGTKVTYAWYKFVDQPALQNLKLTEDQKRRLQDRIVLLHKNWTIDGKYMKPPSKGSLVSMDPKLIVNPPCGLEVGYVPIVIRQESSKQEHA